MDVRCERCSTDYEFDDALISERGTTVKCTNCGHQFKIFPRSGRGIPERWLVRTRAGRDLVYTSLKDLQRAISQAEIGPDDLLSRGSQAPRPLGTIAELEPFFGSTASRPSSSGRKPVTLHGVAPPANTLRQPPRVVVGQNPAAARQPFGQSARVRGPDSHPIESAPATQPARQEYGPAPGRGDPERMSTPAAGSFAVAGPAAAYSPDRAGFDKTTPSATERSAQTKQTAIGLGRALPGMGATLPMVDAASVDMPETQRPSSPVRTSADAAVVSSTAGSARAAMASEDDLHDLALPMGSPARRARFRWIAGLVMVAMFVLVGATVGRRYITELSRPAAPSATPTDQRVSILLREGNRRLAEGDLESAKESFDKASVLGETDPQLRAALARLETVRADLVWLKIRLLDPADMALVEAARKQLADRIGKAESQLANARNSEPSSLDVTRVRLDLLRMRGQLAQARAGVGPLSGHATDPDNAYVLAALDLAETAPVWSSIIERLKSAASAERALGRAQAALVYALTRAGRIADAKMELGKLDAQHPLLAELTAFVRRHETAADAGTGVAVVEAVAASPLPAAGPGAKRASGQEAESAGDFRSKLEQASVALGKGDLNRAEQLYQSVLATHPNSTEALGGLGDVARRRGNSAKAAEYYQRVLDQNPSYLPAMIGLADQKWASGDRKGALVLYRRILDQSGSGSSYGQRAAERIKQAEAAASAPQQAEEPAAPAEQPHIDTTDLPEPTQ